ncbi:hypothetical protein ACSFA3_09600 [Variovorax sp. RHLX14]|uniref:hypothetical protein n=1 Tax=Variovorax sp. RHLX14 TaxID=1259731 RepID=UPI003F47BE7C
MLAFFQSQSAGGILPGLGVLPVRSRYLAAAPAQTRPDQSACSNAAPPMASRESRANTTIPKLDRAVMKEPCGFTPQDP